RWARLWLATHQWSEVAREHGTSGRHSRTPCRAAPCRRHNGRRPAAASDLRSAIRFDQLRIHPCCPRLPVLCDRIDEREAPLLHLGNGALKRGADLAGLIDGAFAIAAHGTRERAKIGLRAKQV